VASDTSTMPHAAVPLPPFRPSFTWTCVFKEDYPTKVDGSLILEVVKPPVIVRHVEVNEGAAPNKFNIQKSNANGGWMGSRGKSAFVGTCYRD
jgi:hypothetical protein